ncbi:LuxR C-terminal-related transcriptional regulator [Caldimonas sp. KR1-144]|uniref:LuxR C-terminal-related transcriptional regulator n=1 Tax=Caldimonas sp. KR1-144 TaxID=3400911 RepID=UPI003C079D17
MNVLLIDDHALFREALVLLFAHHLPEFRLLEADNIGQAVEVAREHGDIALVLLDLGLADSHGMASLAALRDALPELTVVVLSADARRDTIVAAIDAGAAGFVPKVARGTELADALRTVLDGGVYLPAQALATDAPGTDDATVIDALSPRQVQVLQLLLQGKSNKLIGRALDLSESTVKTHLLAIFRRLEVNSRTQAVLAAARLGLRLPQGA